MNREDHIKLLRGVDEAVLPRRDNETDEQYGKRMYKFINGPDKYDKTPREGT